MSKFLKLYEDTLANTQDGFARGIAARDTQAQRVTVDDVINNKNSKDQEPNNVKVAKKLPYQLTNVDTLVGDMFVNIQNLQYKFMSCLHSINVKDKDDVKRILRTLRAMDLETRYIIKKIKKIVD